MATLQHNNGLAATALRSNGGAGYATLVELVARRGAGGASYVKRSWSLL
jgi:hypothetical protein